MGRICKTCAHPDRAEIDRLLAHSIGAKSAIARRFGLSKDCILRHEPHVAESLVGAVQAKDAASATSLLGRVDRMVGRLEKLSDNCSDYGTGTELLAVARDLRPYHELLGRISGELASDRVTALFVNLGVKSESEIRHALDLTRTGRDVTLADVALEALQTMQFLLGELPGFRQDALKLLQRESYAVVEESNNGHSENKNGHSNGDGDWNHEA